MLKNVLKFLNSKIIINFSNMHLKLILKSDNLCMIDK